MRDVLNRLFEREQLSCCGARNITECPDYWVKLAIVS